MYWTCEECKKTWRSNQYPKDECPECKTSPSPITPIDIHELANIIATNVLYHIDRMYPDMWKSVAKTARISLKNTIIQEIKLHFGD